MIAIYVQLFDFEKFFMYGMLQVLSLVQSFDLTEMSGGNGKHRQVGNWATQSAVYSSDSRSVYTSADQILRNSTTALDNWNWGSTSASPFKARWADITNLPAIHQ